MSALTAPMPWQERPKRLAEIEKELDRADEEIETLEYRIENAENEIAGWEKEIEALEAERDRLTGKRDDGIDVWGFPAQGEYGERLIDEAMRLPAAPAYGAPLIGGAR